MTTVGERNALALAEAMKHLSARVDREHERLDGAMATVAVLLERLVTLERLVSAATVGHGPTVK